MDLGHLATSLATSTAQLDAWFAQGGHMSLPNSRGTAAKLEDFATTVARLGLPFTGIGALDLDELDKQGATVKGAIPPNGDSSFTLMLDDRTVTYYAAEITMPGREPFFVKGASVFLPPGLNSGGNAQFLENGMKYLDRLPNSYAEGVRRTGENWLEWKAEPRRLDVHL